MTAGNQSLSYLIVTNEASIPNNIDCTRVIIPSATTNNKSLIGSNRIPPAVEAADAAKERLGDIKLNNITNTTARIIFCVIVFPVKNFILSS